MTLKSWAICDTPRLSSELLVNNTWMSDIKGGVGGRGADALMAQLQKERHKGNYRRATDHLMVFLIRKCIVIGKSWASYPKKLGNIWQDYGLSYGPTPGCQLSRGTDALMAQLQKERRKGSYRSNRINDIPHQKMHCHIIREVLSKLP